MMSGHRYNKLFKWDKLQLAGSAPLHILANYNLPLNRALGINMNLDELVASVTEVELREGLLHWVSEWKNDESDIENLTFMMSKWHGNVWFKDTIESNGFHTRFEVFKKNAVDGIGSLTLNERLYWFGLFEQWDDSNEESQSRIRTKLRENA
jgi:hypothetical protein